MPNFGRYEIRDDQQGPWELDLGRLMMAEGIELQKLTGLGHWEWVQDLLEDRPIALKFAFYLARKRAGEDVAYADIEFNLFEVKILEIKDDSDAVGADDAGALPDEVADVVPTGQAASDEEKTSS